MQERGPAAYLAELIGTFLLVFFITAVVSLFVAEPSPAIPNPFLDWSVIGLVHVFLLFVLIQTLAVVSGAHFNPAVTAAMTMLRQITPRDAGIYVFMQMVGGTLGALLTKALFLDEGRAQHYGATAVSDVVGGNIFPGMVVEALGTFFLLWAIIGVAVNPRAATDWAALAIGGSLGMSVMVFGQVTGAGFNPARAFGPALVGHAFDGGGKFILVYVVGPLVGAAVAVVLYAFLFEQPGRREPGGAAPVG
jgi:glycerol uptake facilitator protein